MLLSMESRWWFKIWICLICYGRSMITWLMLNWGDICVGTKGVSQFYHLCFDDNKVLKLSIGYAKSLFKCTGP